MDRTDFVLLSCLLHRNCTLFTGAFGYFKVTHDITEYTKAIVFSEVGKITQIAVRFSVVSPNLGGADTTR